MNDNDKHKVSIAIGTNVYNRFEDLPNTFSHILAEFVDNALQSYRDYKNELKRIEPDYKLKVDINFKWIAEGKRANEIIVTDNAAGITEDKYPFAFMPAKTPENNEGLNEFGMGLKTAACWLGRRWTVRTKALNEVLEKTINFDLDQVTKNELTELPVEEKIASANKHYTEIIITSPTKNSPTERSLEKIKTELSSIYRKSLRNHEIIIIVNGEELSFKEYDIMCAPFVKDPEGPSVYWKKDIDLKIGKYKAKGFIGILRTMNKDQNRIVLLRRGRVIIGAGPEGHYYSKAISGQSGSPRDKRIFGELELEGFNVAFNKNDIQDKENLDALMETIACEIHSKDFDLTTQAQDYREDVRHKRIKNLVSKHNSSSKENLKPIEIGQDVVDKIKENQQMSVEIKQESGQEKVTEQHDVINELSDHYVIGGINYTLNVQYVDSGKDLFWVDVSRKHENIIICKINTSHVFFKHFGDVSLSTPITVILKTMAIAKFNAKEYGNDTTMELFEYFNECIKKTKV